MRINKLTEPRNLHPHQICTSDHVFPPCLASCTICAYPSPLSGQDNRSQDTCIQVSTAYHNHESGRPFVN